MFLHWSTGWLQRSTSVKTVEMWNFSMVAYVSGDSYEMFVLLALSQSALTSV